MKEIVEIMRGMSRSDVLNGLGFAAGIIILLALMAALS